MDCDAHEADVATNEREANEEEILSSLDRKEAYIEEHKNEINQYNYRKQVNN